MSWAIRGLLRGEFLALPGVGKAAAVGITSTVMAVGLHILGFHYKANVVTAAFTISAAGGLFVTVIGAIAYSILATGMQQGNDRARREF